MMSQKEMKSKIELINNDIVNLQNKINQLQQDRNKLTNQLQNICSHDIATVEKYLDYDRNKYTVTCKECGKTLLNFGNVFEFRKFDENYKGKLVSKE